MATTQTTASTTPTKAYAAHSATTPLAPITIQRRQPTDTDVAIEILFCGICHTDLHQARNEWGGSKYPLVPGHEIVGKVTAVGSKVTKHKIGDVVGVGVIVDSCRTCPTCKAHKEQFCENGATFTYNSPDKHIAGAVTYGGYSKQIVITQDFVYKIASNLDPAAAAPLLCAGITTYSPLKKANIKAGNTVGVVGLGGLGHMAVKLAKAMGASVTVFTTSESKRDAAKKLGADSVVLSKDEKAMEAVANKFDFIIDTVSADHDINIYANALRRDGTFIFVGLPPKPLALEPGNLVRKQINVSGSMIGGVKETQEMLDFCAQHNIVADIELINIQDINKAFDRLERGDVRYRFVIDMKSL